MCYCLVGCLSFTAVRAVTTGDNDDGDGDANDSGGDDDGDDNKDKNNGMIVMMV